MNKGWSIKPEDWEVLEKVLDKSGTWSSVLLTPNDQSAVPRGPGVYAICAPPPSATGGGQRTMFNGVATPLYIGRSESSIRARFLSHCRTPGPELRSATRCYRNLTFWFIELPGDVVKDTEAQLIRCFGPPVNRVAGTIVGTVTAPVDA